MAGLLAEVLGVATSPHTSLNEVLDRIEEREMLIVDNLRARDRCRRIPGGEHLRAAPQVRIPATSREASRIAVNGCASLPPLASPPRAPTCLRPMRLPIRRLSCSWNGRRRRALGYELRDADAPAVGEICRRLDGVALAIELAATQVDVPGLTWLSGHLHEQLRPAEPAVGAPPCPGTRR